MKVLCLTNLYPIPERPAWGAFVRSQMESLRPLGVDFEVLLVRGWEDRLNYWRQRRDVRAARILDCERDSVSTPAGAGRAG